MASFFKPLEQYRTKFYQKEKGFKKFLELSEEHLSELSKKVDKRKKLMEDTTSYNTGRILQLERYYRTMQYLTSPNIHLELKTFDERLAFLIMMCDPNLVTYREFLKVDLIRLEEIFKIEDKKERNRLLELRNQIIAGYETTVREQIGFYDARLLKYEERFFSKFFSDKELITDVKNNYQDNLMARAKALTDFNSITDERYKELVGVAHGWLSMAPDKYNSSVAAYSVTNQKKLLGLKSLAEQLTLFILIVDPELDMLRIYEEESMIPNVERRVIEEFGYYNPELLTLEKKFHSRFCPDKKVSIWTKTKKD